MNASLAPLPNISSPLNAGYQVPLNGSQSNSPQQTFTVKSSNPDIGATVAQGQFLTFNIQHPASSTPGDIAIGVPNPTPVTVQLFNDLTPTTATMIEGFTNMGFYNNKQLFRVDNSFPPENNYIIQGGSPNNTSSGVSHLPGTPFANEIVPQLAFTNPGQLAMANTGQPNSNDTQFFFTTGVVSALNNRFTIFGQVVSGLDVVDQMTKVSLNNTKPVSPITITTATLSNTNPNGVVHIDTTHARFGETSTITVTATDPTTNTSTSQSFLVTVSQAVTPINTGAVRQVGNVLVVTPPAGDTPDGKNTINITQTAQGTIQVFVNGELDNLQPQASALQRIVAYGSKASDAITVDPSVDSSIAVTLDGGHGKHPHNVNVLQAGAGPTREHGWFGKNTLKAVKGVTGTNELIGRTGHVKFRPTETTDVIFAGVPHGFERTGRRVPPGGTFYKLNKKGKLVPIPTPVLKADFQDAKVSR